MPFVSASIYQKAIRLALQEGLDPQLLAPHRQHKALSEGAKYIPMELLLEAYELANRHLNGGFGLRQGRQLHSDDYGTLGLSWRTCWRANDVLHRTERYMVLVTDDGEARVVEENGISTIYLYREARRKGLEIANEATFVMLAGIIREVTEQEIHPAKVAFKHHNREGAAFEAHFQCPVHFGQAEYFLQFHTPHLDIRTVKADRSIHQFLVERMEEEKAGIHTQAHHLLREIHQMIKEALPGGIPSMIQIADYLGMSARTLKRRLADQGVTFRDVVQNIQQEVALDLLRNSGQSMGEIAFQTGFSEQSAFNRAFKRWMGQSPADYRKNA